MYLAVNIDDDLHEVEGGEDGDSASELVMHEFEECMVLFSFVLHAALAAAAGAAGAAGGAAGGGAGAGGGGGGGGIYHCFRSRKPGQKADNVNLQLLLRLL